MRSRKRLIATAGVAIALGAGGWMGYSRLSGNGETTPTYRTQPVERGRVTSTVTATGTLSPLNTVQVGSQVSGRIVEILVDFNSKVKKGQVIARLDTSILSSNVTRAKANLQSAYAVLTRAKASITETKKRYDRTRALAAQNLVAKAEVESALAAYVSAKAAQTTAWADISQAKAALEQAKVNLGYATIISPINGVVISRDVDVGQTVAASLQAPTLFTIAEDLKAMEVHTSVAESDVGKLLPEMKVEFTVDAFPNEKFRGIVKQIRNAPKTEQNVVTYNAVISVNNDQLKLRPGMTANVTFIIADRRDVVAVPNAALRFSPGEKVIAALGDEWAFLKARLSGGPRGQRGQRMRGGGRRGGGGAGGGGADAGGARADGARAPGADAKGPAAGRRRGGRDRRVVWVMVDEQPIPVRITVGITDGRMTEITGGDLAPGAQIIVGVSGGASRRPTSNRSRRGRFL